MKFLVPAFVWLMLLATGQACAAPPEHMQASYDIYKGGIRIGYIEETFAVGKDHRYSIVSTTRAAGLLAIFRPGKIIISSSGLVDEHGLRPLAFSDLREGDEGRNRSAAFDWSRKQLTMNEHNQRTVVPLPDDTQDRLSAMYQFMFLQLSKADTLSFHMTNGGKLDIYNYRITHDQSVTVPLGKFKALYVASVPEAGVNRTEIWLAGKDYDFPYRMVITDPDGGQLIQELAKLTSVP